MSFRAGWFACQPKAVLAFVIDETSLAESLRRLDTSFIANLGSDIFSAACE
jgi:hypothetical protein